MLTHRLCSTLAVGIVLVACQQDESNRTDLPSESAHEAMPEVIRSAEVARAPQNRYPTCYARPTTHIALAGNLAPDSNIGEFDPTTPKTSSNFVATFTVYNQLGWPDMVSMYFVRQDQSSWDYHVFPEEHQTTEVASGRLVYGSDGLLEHHERKLPFTIPAVGSRPSVAVALNLGSPLDESGSGIDGMTTVSAPSMITSVLVDGHATVVGRRCADSFPIGWASDQPPADLGCKPSPDTKLATRANLSSSALVSHCAWNPNHPEKSSHRSFVASFNDDRGQVADATVYLCRDSAAQWRYEVFWNGEFQHAVGGTGQLLFNSNGSLRKASVNQPLRFPKPDGTPGHTITLDFGPSTVGAGNGVDGVISTPAASVLWTASTNGRRGSIWSTCDKPALVLSGCSASPGWSGEAACTGEMTSGVSLAAYLCSDLPIASTSWSKDEIASSTTLASHATAYDIAARPLPLSIYYRHVDTLVWDYHVTIGDDAEVASGLLRFRPQGTLLEMVGPRGFRLPMPDCRRPRVSAHFRPRQSEHFGDGSSAAASGIHGGFSAVAEQVLDQGGDESGRCGGIIRGVPRGRGRFSKPGRGRSTLA